MNSFIWALLASLTWGVVPILEKIGLLRTEVMPGLFYRCIGVLVGMFVLTAFKWSVIKPAVTQPPQGLWWLIVGGFLASVVGQIFFYNALKTGEASKVVPLAASYPLISFVLGTLFLGEQVTTGKVAGLVLVLAGVVLLH